MDLVSLEVEQAGTCMQISGEFSNYAFRVEFRKVKVELSEDKRPAFIKRKSYEPTREARLLLRHFVRR